MQTNLPHWARKPQHKKEVVATPLGWMVKETGEYLKLVKNLDQKLQSLSKELQESVNAVQTIDQEDIEEVQPVVINDQDCVVVVKNLIIQDESIEELKNEDLEKEQSDFGAAEEAKPKRRGRPKRNK